MPIEHFGAADRIYTPLRRKTSSRVCASQSGDIPVLRPVWLAISLLVVAACAGDDTGSQPSTIMSTPTVPVSGSSSFVTPTAGQGVTAPAAGGGAGVGVAGSFVTAGSSGNAGDTAVAGSVALAGSGGMSGGSAGTAGAPTAGSAGAAMMTAAMRCKLEATPDARDEMLTNDPTTTAVGLDKDLLMPQIVLDWMDENQFAQAHDGWHSVRKWDQTCRKSNATSCAASAVLSNQGLKRAPIQQGAPGDGIAFMMMHRHMIMMLNTAFPKHGKLFTGFGKVPRTTSDAENPMPWHTITWTQSNLTGFDTLENIEQHLDQFPTDDDLGQYIENTFKWTAQNPQVALNSPGSGLHGALHAQWSVNGSPAKLIDQSVDVKNFVFWKLHGWIDNVWDRYRKAKKLDDSAPAYQQLMFDQCMEMYSLEPRNRSMPTGTGTAGAGGSGAAGTSAPETGFFATNVRPFLDSACAGCHSPIAPTAGMTLGGTGVSSAAVMQGLVSMKASNGEYNLVEPGSPQRSWLYLKASGDVASATCMNTCDRETMPPSGVGLTAAQLSTLSQWITNGATDK